MKDQGKAGSSTKARLITALILGVSIVLNVSLTVRLLGYGSASPMGSKSKEDIQPVEVGPKSEASAVEETPKVVEPGVPNLDWSQIESADYRQYIANLRAAGFPEQVIRDIITADVQQMFVKRSREILARRPYEYWQKYTNERPTPGQTEQLEALAKEQSKVLKDLLGVSRQRLELTDLVYLQVHGSERQLLLLPTEKREAAMRALADADVESKEIKLHSQSRYLESDEQTLFNEKLKVLATVLTPEELDAFHMNYSPARTGLGGSVRYFNLTPEEFNRLLLAVESKDEKKSINDLVKTLFGDDRAREFEHVSSSFYMNARSGAEAEGVSLDRVDQAARLANDTVKTALAAVNDRTLSVDERKARVQELQSQAESRITNLLGEKGSKTLLRDFRQFFGSVNPMIRP